MNVERLRSRDIETIFHHPRCSLPAVIPTRFILPFRSAAPSRKCVFIIPSSSPPYSVSVAHSPSTTSRRHPRLLLPLLLLHPLHRRSRHPNSRFPGDRGSGNRGSRSRLLERRGARGSGGGFSRTRWLCSLRCRCRAGCDVGSVARGEGESGVVLIMSGETHARRTSGGERASGKG